MNRKIEDIKKINVSKPLKLDCGKTVKDFPLAYETYGKLNENKDNAILIFHALTGDQFVTGTNPVTNKEGWWVSAVGPNKAIDTNKFFVICANVIGGCMGSWGPSGNQKETNQPYGLDFPVITIKDIVRAQESLLEYLGVDTITEEMYEQDQARYHVMTAFAQGLSAARARGGVIDEGNMIYLFDLGINGAMAQAEIMDLLKQEDLLIQDGMAPTHGHTRQWLEQIGDKYQQFVVDGARNKGLIPYNEQALIFGQADE